jgi:hypothetical protein
MIGAKKLSTIREELRAAFAEQGANPIVALDRKLRSLKKSQAAGKETRALVLLRNALAQVVEDKTPSGRKSARTKTKKKAV